jgi:hypothetical protein
MKLKFSFVSDASLANDPSTVQSTLLRRTDTARQWPGTSAAIDLRSGALQRP